MNLIVTIIIISAFIFFSSVFLLLITSFPYCDFLLPVDDSTTSFNNLRSNLANSILQFGPFRDVAPFSVSPLIMSFLQLAPAAYVQHFTRTVEVRMCLLQYVY